MKNYWWSVFKRLFAVVLSITLLYIVAFFRHETNVYTLYWLLALYAAIWGVMDIVWYIFFNPFIEESRRKQITKMMDDIWNEKVADFRKEQSNEKE